MSVSKLLFAAKEDPLYAHKVLGFSCLVSFVYRFANVGSDMNFDDSIWTPATIALHTLLSVTSLVFDIPERRIKHGGRIWPEYRLHSIFFALRSLACMCVLYIFGGDNSVATRVLYTIIVLSTSALADWATRNAKHSSSTIRDLEASESTKFYYSLMQFHGTTVCLYGLPSYSVHFVILFNIQFTAFLMTLQRKNILNVATGMIAYGLMLAFAFVVGLQNVRLYGRGCFGTVALTAAFLRMGLGWNKYLIWSAMCVVVHFGSPSFQHHLWLYPYLLSLASITFIGFHRIIGRIGSPISSVSPNDKVTKKYIDEQNNLVSRRLH